MSLLAGVLVQVLHVLLIGAAAPTILGLCRWLQARLAGRAGPPILQPWRDLARLLRKQPIQPEGASFVSTHAPVVSAMAIVVVACLVPSFALGMTLAPCADLLVVIGLLTLARATMALAAMDAGTAAGGLAASRVTLLAAAAEPALLLVMLTLGLLSGSLNLDLIAAMQLESADWRVAVGMAFAATVLVALADLAWQDALSAELSGPALALADSAAALRLVIWLNLIGAMFLPFGMARADAGLAAWALGIACWLLRTLVLVVALVVCHAVVGRIPPLRIAQMLGVAVLIGLLATLFLYAETGAA